MMIKVCSGWHPAGSIQYGRRFLASFDRHWPADVKLEVYTEEPEEMPRDACRDLWSIPGARDCQAYYGPAKFHGRVPLDRWKEKERLKGYAWRFDAAKFWKQILIPGAASIGMADGDILVWLDGDVETIRSVPIDMIERALADADGCYLGRPPKHSEIGFWAVRISPNSRFFLETIANVYRNGEAIELPEWHSAYVWDHVRKSFEAGGRLAFRNICRVGASGHVFPQTSIGRYLRHDKGERKPRA
jgi:hypothetical protein